MTTETTEPTITEHETAQIERANASSATPVVFVHGLWLLPSSWDRWVTIFEAGRLRGGDYRAGRIIPRRSADAREPRRCSPTRANPPASPTMSRRRSFASCTGRPRLIGHTFGGPARDQILAGRGLSAATVAIEPRSVPRRCSPADLRLALGRRRPAQPRRRTATAPCPLTYDQFRYGFANAVDEPEAKELHVGYSVPGSASRSSKQRRRT